jgi:hypothetical protein
LKDALLQTTELLRTQSLKQQAFLDVAQPLHVENRQDFL